MKRTSLILFTVLIYSAGLMSAQNAERRDIPTITTSAEAVVQAVPDQARIDIGVVTEAKDSRTAASQNAVKTDAVIKRLRTVIGTSGEIKTAGYSLQPNYNYPREGGQPVLTGYIATNIVRVTLNDLTIIGNVIDAATGVGANRVQSLQFTVRNDEAVLAEALREAARRARRKADTLAAALGVQIRGIQTVTESGSPVFPVRDVAYARAEAAQVATPIEPGTIEVRASVTITVEISR